MQRDKAVDGETLDFCCPICGGALTGRAQGAACEKGHCFDRARQGYLHLLPGNKMHSKIPGDTKEMVESRRRFLEAGYYGPFREKLCKLAEDCLREAAQPGEQPVILDAGCGEGYYTGALQAQLPGAKICGFDISKAAVKVAAGKYKGISFAVASSFSIPVPEGFCHLLVDVFSPLAAEEFARVVRPGGFFLYAVPGERHLMGLKELLYDAPYENERRDTEYPGFQFVERCPVRGEIQIPDAQTAEDLFAMTPYYWKTGVDGVARLRNTQGFSTEIAFDFLIYRRELLAVSC